MRLKQWLTFFLKLKEAPENRLERQFERFFLEQTAIILTNRVEANPNVTNTARKRHINCAHE